MVEGRRIEGLLYHYCTVSVLRSASSSSSSSLSSSFSSCLLSRYSYSPLR